MTYLDFDAQLRSQMASQYTPARFLPEHRAIVERGSNAVVQGTATFVATVLAAVRQDLRQPEFLWPAAPTESSTGALTIVVPEVGTCSTDALESLGMLVELSPHRAQIIATSSIALYELVASGRFPARLYYRLNAILLTDDRIADTRSPVIRFSPRE